MKKSKFTEEQIAYSSDCSNWPLRPDIDQNCANYRF